MYRNVNDRIQVTGVELAQRAGEIARTKRISFGDALREARREIQFADTVRQDTGSPLRDQEQSTTPSSDAVREAVTAGLMVVAPTWQAKSDTWRTTTGASVLQDAMRAVASKLDALGLGDQIISGITADLFVFLQNLILRQPYTGTLSDLVVQSADHAKQTYENALAKKGATQVWGEQYFGEAQEFADAGRCVVDVESFALRDAALRLSKQRGISFGEALTMARRGVVFADDVIDPQALQDALTSCLKPIFATIFGGAQQKIIVAMDVLKIKEQVDKALSSLGMGGATSAVTNAVEATLNDIRGVTQVGAIDGIISKAVAAAQKAYTQAISAS